MDRKIEYTGWPVGLGILFDWFKSKIFFNSLFLSRDANLSQSLRATQKKIFQKNVCITIDWVKLLLILLYMSMK